MNPNLVPPAVPEDVPPTGSTSPPRRHLVSRREALVTGGALVTALGLLDQLERLAWIPERMAVAASIPDIQFDIGPYIPPATVIDGIAVRFGPVHTVFVTARLNRAPSKADQQRMADAMDTVENAYPWHPNGCFSHIAYGLPYFNRLPNGLVFSHLPRLLADQSRFALEEAVPSPTDVSPRNPNISKLRFNVPVRIETNDVLMCFRGDNPSYLADVVSWWGGSNTLVGRSTPSPRFDAGWTITSTRAMFVQMGLPRIMAATNRLPWASMVNARSPMWMGFVDQHTAGGAPAPVVTFAGGDGIHLTTAAAGDYFDTGSIQHLSHNIQDLQQFYDVDDNGNPGDDAMFTERVQYMFRSTPPPSLGYANQFYDGGGPAFLPNEFKGVDDAARGAQGIGTPGGQHRLGHLAALQRSSRSADGRPIHQRMDGPGFDSMDVPGGSRQPKLQFSIFVPTADFFTTMRRNGAAVDLAQQFNVDEDENGLERFITSTRRQNFLVPPRRHRSFPLVELT